MGRKYRVELLNFEIKMAPSNRALLLLRALILVAAVRTERTVLVKCESTLGDFLIEVHPDWSPNGAERYLDLVRDGFFTNMPLFRAVKGFLVQFGISMDPAANRKWGATIQDDPYPEGVPMRKGVLSFAGYGKNSRGTQVFIGYEGAAGLGHSPWETPVGEVLRGMERVEGAYSGYGDSVDQGQLHAKGAEYVQQQFPLLDHIHRCFVKRRKQPPRQQRLADTTAAAMAAIAAMEPGEQEQEPVKPFGAA